MHHYQPASAHAGAEWSGHGGYASHAVEPSLDPAYVTPHPQGDLNEQPYDDEAAYEMEEPRPRRGLKLFAAVASAVVVGGGLAYAYTLLLAPASTKSPLIVKSDEGPAKVKPSDPGGKQFAHGDSKIMGRLGEGSAGSEAVPSADGDSSGPRKVPVLVVGRDGSIQPPATPPAPETTRATIAVPGMTVIDGLGTSPASAPPAAAAAPNAQPEAAPVKTAAAPEPKPPLAVKPPEAPKKVAALANPPAAPTPSTTQSISPTADSAAPPPAQKKTHVPKKVAAAPDASVTPQPSTGAGYVAVLASVPASSKSRIDALKQFADMQQKFGPLLQNKTPDVQEANLGEKGTYHRLLVGPPGSRDSASELCTQLKAQGYNDCWVTAY
jgi:hypothetical protein